MSVPIMPLSDYVVVVAEEAENKLANSFLLPEATKEKTKTAKVVAVGKGVSEVKVGDRIAYGYSAKSLPIKGIEYIFVEKKEILGTVK